MPPINTQVTSMVADAKAASSAGGAEITSAEARAILSQVELPTGRDEALSALRAMGISEADAQQLLQAGRGAEAARPTHAAANGATAGTAGALQRPETRGSQSAHEALHEQNAQLYEAVRAAAREAGPILQRALADDATVLGEGNYSLEDPQNWFLDFIDMIVEFFTGGAAQTVWGGDVIPDGERRELTNRGQQLGMGDGAIHQLHSRSREDIVGLIEERIYAANPNLDRTNPRDASGVRKRAEVIADAAISTVQTRIETRRVELEQRRADSQTTIEPVDGYVPAQLFPGWSPEQIQAEVNRARENLDSMTFINNGPAGQLSTGQEISADIVLEPVEGGEPQGSLMIMVGGQELPPELAQAIIGREPGALDRLEAWMAQQNFTPPLARDAVTLAALELLATLSNRGEPLQPVDQAQQTRAREANWTIHAGDQQIQVPAHLFPTQDGIALQERIDQRTEAIRNGDDSARYDTWTPAGQTSQGQTISAQLELREADAGEPEQWTLEVNVGGQTIPSDLLEAVRNNAEGATERLAQWLEGNALLRPPASDPQALAAEVAGAIRNEGDLAPYDAAATERMGQAHMPMQPAEGKAFTAPVHLMGGQEAAFDEMVRLGQDRSDISFAVEHEAGRLPSGQVITAQMAVERRSGEEPTWSVSVSVGGEIIPDELLADVRANREGATERLAQWLGQQTLEPPVENPAQVARSLAGAIRNEPEHALQPARSDASS